MPSRLKDFLSFKWMITPLVIQIFFWLGVAVAIASGIWTIFTFGLLKGLWVIVVGPIISRVICETLIILFRINENLAVIKDSLRKPG